MVCMPIIFALFFHHTIDGGTSESCTYDDVQEIGYQAPQDDQRQQQGRRYKGGIKVAHPQLGYAAGPRGQRQEAQYRQDVLGGD
jgi:hypothetical protein